MHEDLWQRRYARLELTPEQVRAMLATLTPDGVPPDVLSIEPLSGGRCNTNLRVALAGRDDPVVLRVYVRGDEYCQIECDAFALVRNTVPVPTILAADPLGERFGRPYVVEGWVAGTRLDETLAASELTDAEALGKAVGATLAAIHAHPFPRAGFLGPGLTLIEPMSGAGMVYAGHIGELLAQPGTRAALGADLAARLNAALLALATQLAVLDAGPVSLVHGDYKGSNILVQPSQERDRPAWRVAAVLDWEFVHAGAGLLDFSILLRNMVLLPAERAAAFERGVERGYRDRGGWLPPDWRWLAEVFDLISLIEFAAVAPADSLQAREIATAVTRTLDGARARGLTR